MKIVKTDTDTRTDEVLLEQYRRDHTPEILGILFNRYLHLVYGLCLKYLKDREDAQDAVMSIFETLTEKLKTQEIQYFKSWLYVVSKNHCLMQLRKAGGNEKINGVFMETQADVHLITEEDQLNDDLGALEECINELKSAQQKCVRSFYLEEKSYLDIARETAYKLSRVKSYIQNGKRNLKICLEKKNVKR